MGKKKRKSRGSSTNSSSALLEDCSLLTVDSINNSFEDGDVIPEKLLISSVEAAKISAYVKSIKLNFKNLIFLHPSVMRTYKIEDLVLVKGERKTVLCYSYPLDALKRSLLVFLRDADYFQFQELVSLLPYKNKVRPAEEILISFSERLYIDQRMLDSILELLCDQYIYVGMLVQWTFFDKIYECTVSNIICLPDMSCLNLNETCDNDTPQFYTVSFETILKVESNLQHPQCKIPAIESIDGIESQISIIKKDIHVFLNSGFYYDSAYCGTIMLNGPSGTGKSLMLDAICREYKIATERIMWYNIYSVSHLEAEQELTSIFQRAIENAPSFIIIDEFNYLCPSKNKSRKPHQYVSKVLSQLVESLDDSKVMIIAASNDTEWDDSVLKTSRRLLDVVKFQIPTSQERIAILGKLLSTEQHDLSFEKITECAELAHGFTGKDFADVIKDAQLLFSKRNLSHILDSKDFFNIMEKENFTPFVKYNDLKMAIKLKKPTIVAAHKMQVKKVRWSDIGGVTGIKENLKQLIEWPYKYPEVFNDFKVTPTHGILMYGPPGCSKTMIAKALATECGFNFISKNASDLFDKYVGESEKAVRDLFALAKAKAPCIIFLDEIDALAAERGSSSGESGVGNRIVTTLLTEMDGVEELNGVIIIAATNRPDKLDAAFIRNGRINDLIYVPLPDFETREAIIRLSMKNRSVSEDFDFKYLSLQTEGYSGAEVVNLCNEAALQLLSEDPTAQCPIFTLKHFENALKYVLPRTDKQMIKFYENFNAEHCKR